MQETDLFRNTQGFLRQFGIDPTAVMPDLLAASQDYAFRVAEISEAGSRGGVLVELHDLHELPAQRRERYLLAVSQMTIGSLCGLFPSSMIALEEFEQESEHFRVIDDLAVLVSTFKSSVARSSARNVPAVRKIRGEATALSALAREDTALARRMLIDWAKRDPASFADHVGMTISRQEETFQVAGQAGGRNVRLEETVTANPDWSLINAVLDIIWPIEKGMLHARKREALGTILTQTKSVALAQADSDQCDGDDPGHMDPNSISAVLTLRHQIDSLNRSLRFLEVRREALQRTDDFSEAGWKREERLDRVAFYPLLDWRRELQRRLLHGDYRPWKRDIRRATGPVMKLPDMPIFNKWMSMPRRTLMLIRAARPLR